MLVTNLFSISVTFSHGDEGSTWVALAQVAKSPFWNRLTVFCPNNTNEGNGKKLARERKKDRIVVLVQYVKVIE